VFCVEFVVNGYNAMEAWLSSGEGKTSRSTAKLAGSHLMDRPEIQARIKELHEAALAKQQLSVDRVIQEMARIAFSDPRKFYHEDGRLKQVSELGDDEAAALAGFEQQEITAGEEVIGTLKKIKRWDKTRVLEKFGEHLGLFESGGGKVPTLIVNIVRCRRLEKPPGENE
jgi:phage terminase small subunit